MEPPGILETLAVTGVTFFAVTGLFGMVLVLRDAFQPWPAMAVGAIAALLVGWRLVRVAPWRAPSRGALIGMGLALLITAGYAASTAATPSAAVVLNRDPSSYVNTGRWLADNETLRIDAADEAFADIEGLSYNTAAIYDLEHGQPHPGTIRFQFNHLVGVLLACAYAVGGNWLMFRLPAIAAAVSVLLVYLLAARLTRRPIISLLAPLLLASNIALLHLARNTYSEPFTLLFTMTGMLAASLAAVRPRPVLGLAAGLAFGAAVASRIDALMIVAIVTPIVVLALIDALARRRGSRPTIVTTWGLMIAVTAAGSLIGWLDLQWLAGDYPLHLADELAMLRKGTLASVAVSGIGGLLWWFGLRRLTAPPWLERGRSLAATLAAVAVVALLLFGWFVRPHIQTARGVKMNSTVAALEEREGLPADGFRTFAEDTMKWNAWYLGEPGFVLAITGLGAGVHALGRRRVTTTHWLVLAGCLAAGALYWWTPRNTPDHPWVMRRFMTASLPLLIVWSAYGLSRIATLAERSRTFGSRAVAVGALSVTFLAVMVVPLQRLRPVRWQQQQPGYVDVVEAACDLLPANAAVVMVGGTSQNTLPQAMRSWCGVPTASAGRWSARADMAELEDIVSARGFELTVVSADPGAVEPYRELSSSPIGFTPHRESFREIRTELEKLPDRYAPQATADHFEGHFQLAVLPLTEDGTAAGA